MPLERWPQLCFSRWISRYIVSIPFDNFYYGSHCTHQSHISGTLQTPPPPTMRRNSARIGASQSPSGLLSLDSPSSISCCSQILLFQHISARIGTPQSPLFWLEMLYFIPPARPPFPGSSAFDVSPSIPTGCPILDSTLVTIPPPFRRSSTGRALLNPHWCFSDWNHSPSLQSTLQTSAPPAHILSAPPLVWTLLNPDRLSAV